MNQTVGERCPLCGSTGLDGLSVGDGKGELKGLAECRRCGLVRTISDPGKPPMENPDFSKYYGRGASKFVPVAQTVRNQIMRARAKNFLTLVPPGVRKPRILDVGCAEGRLLKAFLEKGCECVGVEHPAYPKERFLFPDRITYLRGSLCDLELRKASFDLIFLWHVLEHLEQPDLQMKRLLEVLRPEGSIILAVPNFASLESRCFKGNWFHLDLPWHRVHFTERSLNYLIEKNHLQVKAMSSLCLEQGPFGLIQSLFNAMGWPRNELYEVLKGHWISKRSRHLLVQFGLAGVLAIPAFLASLLTSRGRNGPVLKRILGKPLI